MRDYRIIYNDDNCGLRTIDPPHATEQISRVVDYLKGSQVGCVTWFMASEVAYAYDSEVIDSIYDLYERDPEFVPGNKSLGRNLPLSLHQQGIDYLPMLIDQFHSAGIAFYGSLRMNDAHHKSAPNSWLVSDFWRENQDKRLWEVQDGFGYYNAPLDYSYPEVRDQKTAVVREILERYDIDGIELDFIRNPYAFQPSEAWGKRQVLTDLIAEIKSIVDEFSRKKGHELGLIVRVPFQEEEHRNCGMEVDRWLEDGILDILVVSDKANNYNRQLEPWLSKCRDRGVLFYPSVEAGPKLNCSPETMLPHGVLPPRHNAGMRLDNPVRDVVTQMRGMASNYLAQGPDGIYLFNYPCKLFETEWSHEDFERMADVVNEIGRKETIRGKEKLYYFSHDLPIYVEASRPAQYYQTVAFRLNELAENEKVTLSFRRAAAQNPHAYVRSTGPELPSNFMQTILNGRALDESTFVKGVEEMEVIPSGFANVGTHERIEINLTGRDLVRGENTLAFEIPRCPKEEDPYVYIYELMVRVGVLTPHPPSPRSRPAWNQISYQ